jgi:hypothetical protein
VQLIPEAVARRYNAIPLTISNRTLEVAMVDPTDIFALEAMAAHSRMRIKPIAASARDVRDAIDFNYKAYGEIESRSPASPCPPRPPTRSWPSPPPRIHPWCRPST